MVFNIFEVIFMKKILSFILVLMMIMSVGILTGCKDADNTDTATPDSVSTEESAVAGVWRLATTDEIEWHMNSQNTLHITEDTEGKKFTIVCNYTYDKDTNEFTYTALNASDKFEGTAFIEGGILRVTSKDGKVTYTLTKIE